MSFEGLVRRIVAEELERVLDPALSEVRFEIKNLARAVRERGTPTEFLSTAQAAELMGVTPHTVRAWVNRGRLPGYGSPRALRVRRADLFDLTADGTVAPNVQRRAAEIVDIHGGNR